MSYTEAYRIELDGTFTTIAEFKNSHGFGPFVWAAVSSKYFGDKHSWLSHEKELWPLWKDKRLPKHWSAALLVSYDNAIIEYSRFKEISQYLKDFAVDVGKRDRVCHLLDIATLLDNSPICIGICFYGTSLSDNPWHTWDGEKEEEIDYNIQTGKKHFFVGESLDSLPLAVVKERI